MSFSFLLDVTLFKTKIMMSDQNKRKSSQEEFYLGNYQLELTHEYKYLGVVFYLHVYFTPSSKRQGIVGLKVVMQP